MHNDNLKDYILSVEDSTVVKNYDKLKGSYQIVVGIKVFYYISEDDRDKDFENLVLNEYIVYNGVKWTT